MAPASARLFVDEGDSDEVRMSFSCVLVAFFAIVSVVSFDGAERTCARFT